MHEKANQGLTLSIILLIPQPSKLLVGRLVSCTNGVIISSNVQRYHCRDGTSLRSKRFQSSYWGKVRAEAIATQAKMVQFALY